MNSIRLLQNHRHFLHLEDDEERAKRRWLRKEIHLVNKLCNEREFESVKPKEVLGAGLCFGSRSQRRVLPVGASYWDPKFAKDSGNEEREIKQSVVSSVPRFIDSSQDHQQIPAPNYYRIPQGKVKVWRFYKDLPRDQIPDNNGIIVGPGSYNPSLSTIKGHSSSTTPACYSICCPYPEDILCIFCQCPVIGDYFYSPVPRRLGGTPICRQCFKNSTHKRTPKLPNFPCFNTFKRVRNCQFFHEHLDTEKAVAHLSHDNGRSLRHKLRIENYLAKFNNNSIAAGGAVGGWNWGTSRSMSMRS